MGAVAAERPAGRVSEVFDDAAARQGAYDFLESGLGSGAIAQATADATLRRAHKLEYIVVPVDGTSLNLTDKAQAKGFGSIGARDRGARGLKLIDAIALSPAGVPLGLLTMQWWSRPLKANPVSLSLRCHDEKETRYWLEAIDGVSDRLAQDSAELRAWFHVDREGDSQHVLEETDVDCHWFTVRAKLVQAWRQPATVDRRMERSTPFGISNSFCSATGAPFSCLALGCWTARIIAFTLTRRSS
jgi:hypothetical protein